jgi:hypothetical protein
MSTAAAETQQTAYEVSEFVNVKPGFNPVQIRRYKAVHQGDGNISLQSLDTATLLGNVISALKGKIEQSEANLIAVFSSPELAQEFARITAEFYHNTVQVEGERVFIPT